MTTPPISQAQVDPKLYLPADHIAWIASLACAKGTVGCTVQHPNVVTVQPVSAGVGV